MALGGNILEQQSVKVNIITKSTCYKFSCYFKISKHKIPDRGKSIGRNSTKQLLEEASKLIAIYSKIARAVSVFNTKIDKNYYSI